MHLHRLATLLTTWAMAALPHTGWAQTTDAAYRFSVPEPVRVLYGVEGVIGAPYTGTAELVWQREGGRYTAQLFIKKFGLNLQTWTSKGTLSPQGLEPERFASQRIGQAEVNAQLLRPQKTIQFSAGTPEAPLQAGAQDQLSVFMQLAGLVKAQPDNWSAGTSLTFQAVGDRYAEVWTFKSGAQTSMTVAGSRVSTIPFTHEPTAQRSQKLELWYAPGTGHWPLRIRITESNGDFLDLLWTGSEKP